jgi:His/Glu/Gln/Arg/opine family amino acid ABC transporter permease subunit
MLPMAFDFSTLLAQQDALIAGVFTTIKISMASVVLAIALGFIVSLGRKTTFTPLHWLLAGYVQFFRNTPLLVQIYFFYKGLPAFGVTLSPMNCGILALSLQTGAYMAEIFRTGIESIPREQFEGGLSLGFSPFRTFITVILPQAIGIILPPVGNQIVGLIKNSSLVAFITVPDLFFVVFKGAADHFQYLEFFTAGILLYMGLTLAVSGFFILLENRLPLLQRVRGNRYA